jgi:DNA-binding XRE family transcriptional regulator
MRKRFRDLLEQLPEGQRERIATRRDEILREISLKQLRRALRLTQRELAGTLRVNQAAISKMEGQYDMYISTLRRFLEGMGARLKIIAEFPDGEITISQFHQKNRGKVRA